MELGEIAKLTTEKADLKERLGIAREELKQAKGNHRFYRRVAVFLAFTTGFFMYQHYNLMNSLNNLNHHSEQPIQEVPTYYVPYGQAPENPRDRFDLYIPPMPAPELEDFLPKPILPYENNKGNETKKNLKDKKVNPERLNPFDLRTPEKRIANGWERDLV